MLGANIVTGRAAVHEHPEETEMEMKTGRATNEKAAPAASGAATRRGDAASPGAGRWVLPRRRLRVSWGFARHFLEMVAAMAAGMAVLGVAVALLGEPPGYALPLVEHGLMGASMSAPMVLWMRYRGHSWSDGAEMTAAMLVPMLALVLPAELGALGNALGPTDHSLAMLSHAAMLAGMVALMVYRRDRYTHGARL